MINAVIVAAGKGLRMNNNIKKQYMPVNGLPLLCHSLKTFDRCNIVNNIYLTVPKSDIEMCKKRIIRPLKLNHKVEVISGGATRQSSVMNSLQAINDSKGIVLIHDGARPFIRKKLILRCIEGVSKTGACIPAIAATDSLKKTKVNNSFITTIERKNLWLAQTPQVFRFDLILEAHRWAKRKNFQGTDDSSILEIMGIPIKIVQGHSYNIKITTKDDLILAEAIAKIMQK